MNTAPVKCPEVPDRVIEEIAMLAKIEDPKQVVELRHRLRPIIETMSIKASGFQKTAKGVAVNKDDSKDAKWFVEQSATLLHRLKKVSPHLRLALGTEFQTAVDTVNVRSHATYNNLSSYNGKMLRLAREFFWLCVFLAVEQRGGRLRYDARNGGSVEAVIELLRPYLPKELANVSARTVWNMRKCKM
jgi:hypothetical protein